MTTQEFDLKLRHIDEQYHARKEGADAYRDQEVARLFVECGWTQEKIAGRMGKVQNWVSKRLVFGRFLEFSTTGTISPDAVKNLTERRFRALYQRTKDAGKGRGKVNARAERERFAQVLEMLNGPQAPQHPAPQKSTIRAAIAECLADGQWYSTQEIQAFAEERVKGLTMAQTSTALNQFHKRPPAGKALETSHAGRLHQYRLIDVPDGLRSVDPARLVEFTRNVESPLKDLEHLARLSTSALAHALGSGELKKIAHKIRRALALLVEEGQPVAH